MCEHLGETDEIGEAREQAEVRIGERRADQRESWHDTKIEQKMKNETFIEQKVKNETFIEQEEKFECARDENYEFDQMVEKVARQSREVEPLRPSEEANSHAFCVLRERRLRQRRAGVVQEAGGEHRSS
mmetsp:Transcript_135894/g.434752  ORF Transcript_135894/g.434752 Transcript_135894/m.434752 type:complete len:129 (+) Transcript_135894:319-705(+)